MEEKLSIGGKTSKNTEDNKTGSWRTFKPVIDKKKCKGCGICIKACPETGMGMNEKENVVEINYDYCKGCMLCASVCPQKAIHAEKEEKK